MLSGRRGWRREDGGERMAAVVLLKELRK